MSETQVIESPTEERDSQPTPVNYWGVEEIERWTLPDGIQYFEFKIMTEGDKARFQKLTNQDLTINRDQSAKVRVDPAEERHTLIKTSVVGWKLYMPERNTPGAKLIEATFSQAMLNNWLQVAPPKLVEDLERAIRLANPWMQADMTPEGIQEEIDRLLELKREVEKRDLGEHSSATK